MNQVADGALHDDIARLLVVDDHPLIHEGLTRLLERERGLRVEWLALGAEDALEICRNQTPEMAIVDISLQGRSGIDLVKAMHDLRPSMRLLVLSGRNDWLYAERALRAGARAYLMKHGANERILEAIHQVREGHIYLGDDMRTRLLERALAGGKPASAEMADLSDRELEIFELIGEGFNKKEIAVRLGISVNTVNAHRASIKTKLDIESSAMLARFAFLHSQEDLWPQSGLCPWAANAPGCPFCRLRPQQSRNMPD